MQDFERPSILAVGLPEIFENAEAGSNGSTQTMAADRMTGVLTGSLTGGMTPRISSDRELLRWMIFSSKNATAVQSEFGAGNLRMSESASTRDDSVCDDSAFGLTLDQVASGETAVSSDTCGDASGEVSFIYASSAKRAIELLRIMRFDLLVTSDQLPDMAVSQLVGRVRAVRPWQKWALVMSGDVQGGNAIQSEIAARSMGAAAIFDAPGDLGMISELARAVAVRQPAKMAVGGSAEESIDEPAARRRVAPRQSTVKGRKTTRSNRAKA